MSGDYSAVNYLMKHGCRLERDYVTDTIRSVVMAKDWDTGQLVSTPFYEGRITRFDLQGESNHMDAIMLGVFERDKIVQDRREAVAYWAGVEGAFM